jgi:hypothetical protein
MKFDVIVGNPPYQAPKGFEVPEAVKEVDGRFGKKQLYYYFIKKSLEKTDDLIFVLPTTWLRNDDAKNLRLWLRKQNIKVSFKDVSNDGYFPEVATKAGIFHFSRNLPFDGEWYGEECLWVESKDKWIKKWIDIADAGHLMKAHRGGVKMDKNANVVDYYATYSRGLIVNSDRIKNAKPTLDGKQIILVPEYLGTSNVEKTIFSMLKKSQIVDNKPFSDIFLGIEGGQEEMEWMQSDVFVSAMIFFNGSSHSGSLCKYFIKKSAWENYVKTN